MKRKINAVRRDVPYVNRLAEQKRNTVLNYQEAAMILALKIACVALNDTEGLGFVRLCRFSERVTALMKEYYTDAEVSEAKLNRRLEALGFDTSGGGVRFCVDENGKYVRPDKKRHVGECG